ncbi:hypothetical protein FOIG_07543 [Fusarium odoratissimum NRRL 54006]|uniref:Uncharacterized protein n=1 Tax=Fusarium odoratissimum (strain NRRL 54006) TaxID=1089451 RepID=X0JW41_FUSO5|nr:uncharacterized protein FOIG_07543 [Fusarium odoratissimum NRRL 54006]EXM00561.1 hypothetical protein FOIG_07543 [Fusarium odoratissimum NRRL 54006]
MASLDPIATAFIDYKYDEAVGFEGIDGIPCLACVATIDHDVRCRCLVNESGDTSCLLCDRNETVCDLYWNFVVNLSRRESQTSYRSSVSPTATGRQIWRRGRALGGCGSAWRELHMRLKNPDNLKILAVKESTSSREMLALSLLQSVGQPLAEYSPITRLLSRPAPIFPWRKSAIASPLSNPPTLAPANLLAPFEIHLFACPPLCGRLLWWDACLFWSKGFDVEE